MDDDVALLFDLEDMRGPERQRNVYQRPQPVDGYTDATFKSVYRMTKASALELCELIRPFMSPEPAVGRKPIPLLLKLLICLQYLAGATFSRRRP